MNTKIGTAKTSSGMGDVLLLTALCKHTKNLTVELYPDAEKYKIFFDNICKEVIISDNATITQDVPPGHFAQQKLKCFGLDNVCYLPYIYPKSEYTDKGLGFIKQYSNPIAFVANCSPQHSSYREPNKSYLQNIVNRISEKYTVLQFGISSNFTELKNTIPIIDIPIYDLICYYSAIKKFMGVDTGDAHLMIAVGGSCDIIIPSNTLIRNPDNWNYKNYDHIRYQYF